MITSLLKELSKHVSAKWELIGVHLNIEVGVLERIKHDYSKDSQMAFYEMLKEWIKQVDPPPTWSTILDVIHFLGHEHLAKDLRDKYVKWSDM